MIAFLISVIVWQIFFLDNVIFGQNRKMRNIRVAVDYFVICQTIYIALLS